MLPPAMDLAAADRWKTFTFGTIPYLQKTPTIDKGHQLGGA